MSQKQKSMAATATGGSAVAVERESVLIEEWEVTDADIAERAYRFWEERGFQGGSAEDDWYRAAAELRSEREQRLKRNE